MSDVFFEEILIEERLDRVLVYGDTNRCFAAP